MRAFIYDKYGYYPSEEFATSFEYQGWFFKLELSEKNDREIHALRILLSEVSQKFPSLGSDILLTRDGRYVSSSEYGPVVLIAVKNADVDFKTLVQLHHLYLGRFSLTKLKISHLRNLWINKTNIIEEKILSSLPLDDKEYSKAYVLGHYALGLAENAIQYLLDTALYYGDEIVQTTLVHKRLDEWNSFYLLNPFNLVIDSPMRDLAELYKNNQINLEQLYLMLKDYSLSRQDASLLLARCLFPSTIFDILEDYYELKKNIKNRIEEMVDSLESRILKLKKLYRYLVKNYQIRPINWLE